MLPFSCRHGAGRSEKETPGYCGHVEEMVAGPSAKDKKLKMVLEVAPSEDKETCSDLVFKRKRKVDAAIPMPSNSDSRAPSYKECPPSASSPCNIAVHEGRGESASEGDQWDSSTDLSSFLQKVLHSTRIKERLENLEEDPLLKHVSRQLGETLVRTSLLLSKMRRAKELASQEVLQATELKRRVTGLTLKVEELRKADRETKGLLFEKSQETLRLYARNGDLRP